MGNRFQDLKDRRDAEWACKQRAAKARADQRARDSAYRTEIADLYDSMVRSVLCDLRDAAYSRYARLEAHEGSGEVLWCWEITSDHSNYGDHWTEREVQVLLLADQSGAAAGFECSGYKTERTIRCGLSEAALVDALRRLHT